MAYDGENRMAGFSDPLIGANNRSYAYEARAAGRWRCGPRAGERTRYSDYSISCHSLG
jgi:hypothetical protein